MMVRGPGVRKRIRIIAPADLSGATPVVYIAVANDPDVYAYAISTSTASPMRFATMV
jgi:hypothetical protein